MELKTDTNIIEIRPNAEIANLLISEELKRYPSLDRLHPNITDVFDDIVIGEVNFNGLTQPLEFTGGNDKQLYYDGEMAELYNNLCSIVERHVEYVPCLNKQWIDNLLFVTLFSWGEYSERKGSDNKKEYLDDLIELYLSLRDNKVQLCQMTNKLLPKNYRNKGFESLPNDIQQELVSGGDVDAQGRLVGGQAINRFVYIPSHMEIFIDGMGSNDIILPKPLANKLYQFIFKEIVEQHQAENTIFYKKLSNDDFDSIELGSTIKFRRSNKNVKLLNYLIVLMDSVIVRDNKFEITKKNRYVLIYDILKALNYFSYNHPRREDKYSYVKTIIRDNKPEKQSKALGEKQFFN